MFAVLRKFVAGFCAGDLERFCAATRPGEGRIALCLTKQLEIEQESKGTVEGKHWVIVAHANACPECV